MGRSPAPTYNRLGLGLFILVFLFKVGAKQFAILDGGQQKENAYEKVFHKKPGMKSIKNTSALQGSIDARGAEEQFVG